VAAWHRFDPDRNVLCINLTVQPNARQTQVVGKHDANLKIRVAGPAVEQRANKLVVEFLSETLDVPASRISIRRGLRAHKKSVEIDRPGETALRVIREWDMT
jgi:uncharacterized protein (TIGR00251 family)